LPVVRREQVAVCSSAFGPPYRFLDSPRRLATQESLHFLELSGVAP
jgi:hypothetical protein